MDNWQFLKLKKTGVVGGGMKQLNKRCSTGMVSSDLLHFYIKGKTIPDVGKLWTIVRKCIMNNGFLSERFSL